LKWKRASLAAKTAATFALLAWALSRSDLGAVVATLGTLDVSATLLVAALTFASVGVAAVRWYRVLARLGERPAPVQLLGDLLVGTTYNLFLPSSVGGDVVRAYRAGRRLRQTEHAAASVAFERVVGLVALALVSCIGLLGAIDAVGSGLWLASLGLAAALGLALVLAPQALRRAARLLRRISLPAANALRRVADCFAGPLSSPGARLEAFGWSLGYQCVSLTILYIAGRGWAEPELGRAVYLGVPVALVAGTAPISIGGHGLRESLFVTVLVPFGLSPARALALSLVWLASSLLTALAGAAVLALGLRAQGVPSQESPSVSNT
jgi:glycosyltransferase 2 family protein